MVRKPAKELEEDQMTVKKIIKGTDSGGARGPQMFIVEKTVKKPGSGTDSGGAKGPKVPRSQKSK